MLMPIWAWGKRTTCKAKQIAGRRRDRFRPKLFAALGIDQAYIDPRRVL